MSHIFSSLYQFVIENLFWAIFSLSLLALVCGIILGYASKYFFVEGDPIADNIDAILPQSQCAQCGYPGCKPYAEAVALNGEAINKCAPGGEQVMLKIAELLGVDPQPIENEENLIPIKKVAFIDEANCIGCVKCIQVCPVDAIIGATRAMHTVVVDACTGCDLCVAPCPTNCISMIPVAEQNQYRFKQLSAIDITLISSTSSTPNSVRLESNIFQSSGNVDEQASRRGAV